MSKCMARRCGKKYGFCKHFSIFCKHFSIFVSIFQFFVSTFQFFVSIFQFFVSTFQFFVSTFQFFVSTIQFFVSTSQFFVTRFKKKLSTHLKTKMCRHFLGVCAVLKKKVSTVFFVCIIVIFYVRFNILRKRVKDHTCLYYAIIILCYYYIVVS